MLKNSTQNQLDPEILQETIEERIISRSRLCQYAVIRNTNLPNNHQICNECKMFFPSTNENHEVKEEIVISDDEGTYIRYYTKLCFKLENFWNYFLKR